MATTTGLTYAPQALDPYQIETELAKVAYNQPQQQTLMDQYWFERMANKNLYGQEIEQNRQLQQQQMVNALREKALGQLKEGGTIPGVASVIAPYLGLTPDQTSALSGAATQAAGAENFSRSASGLNYMSEAGFGVPVPQAQQLTGVTGLVPQDPRAITVEKLRDAAMLRAAAIRAAGQSDGGLSVSQQLPNQPAFGGAPATVNINKKFPGTAADAAEALRRKGYTVDSPGAASPPPSQRGATNLPVAKTDTPANNAPAAASSAKAVIEANKAKIPAPVYQDIVAGGYKTVQGPDGKTRVQGASGKLY